MWIYGRFLILVNSAAAFVAALVVGLWYFISPKSPIRSGFQEVTVHTLTVERVTLFALAILGLNLVYLVMRFILRPKAFITVHTEPGEVAVSIAAVEDSLARAAQQIPEVVHARVTLAMNKSNRSSVTVKAVFSIWEDGSVKFAAQKVQAALHSRFRQLLGGEIMPTFEIALTRIVVRDARKGKKDKEEMFRESFRGPEYPVDGGI